MLRPDGSCGCSNDQVSYALAGGAGNILCCAEGQVDNRGSCADTCDVGLTPNLEGVCGL